MYLHTFPGQTLLGQLRSTRSKVVPENRKPTVTKCLGNVSTHIHDILNVYNCTILKLCRQSAPCCSYVGTINTCGIGTTLDISRHHAGTTSSSVCIMPSCVELIQELCRTHTRYQNSVGAIPYLYRYQTSNVGPLIGTVSDSYQSCANVTLFRNLTRAE